MFLSRRPRKREREPWLVSALLRLLDSYSDQVSIMYPTGSTCVLSGGGFFFWEGAGEKGGK